MSELDRCSAEIAEVEAALLAGHRDVDGLTLALADWSMERRMVQAELKAQRTMDRLPVGTVRIRTRHKRGGEKRAFIKVEEPNKWELRAREIPFLNRPGAGITAKDRRDELVQYMCALSNRLRRVRVCCGDWSRVCGPSPTVKLGTTGVFLDPPYADEATRSDDLYSTDDGGVSHSVRAWAIDNGNNPQLRIALCGYDGEHTMPPEWECVAWKARGGYGSQGDGRGRDNAARERIWFSPACLKLGPLFAEEASA